MKLFIFTEILKDYTSGMAVVAAESIDDAIELAVKEIMGPFSSYTSEPGNFIRESFRSGDVEIVESNVETPRVIAFVYGGA